MSSSTVSFSIASEAAWAPGVETRDAWLAWASNPFPIVGDGEPKVQAMAPMLRRRAGALGKMALEVSYQCIGERTDVPTLFCSRHGEVSRSVQMLIDLAQAVPLSPTSFGLSVHNAIGGLFSIARNARADNIGLAGGADTVEHGVIEACGLLADGAPAVLLVVYDYPLPQIYAAFRDEPEQPYAWAWLMQAPSNDSLSLSWSAEDESDAAESASLPAGLAVLRFQLLRQQELQRHCGRRRWTWARHA